jgi:hypothetical protein
MPDEWQGRFLCLIDEVNQTLEYEGKDYDYMVKRRADNGKFLSDPLANYRYPPPIRKKEGTAMAQGSEERLG